LQFIEHSLYLIPLGPRHQGFSVLSTTHISADGAKALSMAADGCWNAILSQDIENFGRQMRLSFEAQVAMFPNMMNEMIGYLINQFQQTALGWKVSGAGGGGYLILVSAKPIHNALRILIRRASD
jgi:galactokinase/mevalonate kinase-like predicted kinase